MNENEQLIYSARTKTNEAIAKHDLKTLTNFWMDDIVIVRGNGDIIINKILAEAVWKEMFEQQQQVSFIREPEEIITDNNKILAWEKGKWKGINTYSGGGNYAAIWKKQNNAWKLQAELFVSLE